MDERERPQSYEEMFPGRFLKAAELKRPVTLKIRDVYIEELPGDKGPEKRGVIEFERTEKEMTVNRTNAECLRAMWGKRPADWIGHRITIDHDPDVMFGKDKVGGIRVLGSPDLDKPITFSLKLPRKRARQVTLIITGKKPGGPNDED